MNSVNEKDLGEIKKQMNFLVDEVANQQENIISSLHDALEVILTPQSPKLPKIESGIDDVKESPTEDISILAESIKNVVENIHGNNLKIKEIINAIEL